MTEQTPKAPAWHLQTVLRLADDALILAQRNSEWCGHGPILEEDLAMTNIGLDLIGQTRMLLAYAGELEGEGRDEDKMAMFRNEEHFYNHAFVELPNGDGRAENYAITLARNWLFAARAVPMWQALMESSDQRLAEIAAKAIKESIGLLRHSRDWMVRLGDGTEESNEKMQDALDRLWPYTNEFWQDDDIDRAAADAGVSVLPSSIRATWDAEIDAVLAEAMLTRPGNSAFLSTGKQGVHTEYLGIMLAEMQSLARAHPNASW